VRVLHLLVNVFLQRTQLAQQGAVQFLFRFNLHFKYSIRLQSRFVQLDSQMIASAALVHVDEFCFEVLLRIRTFGLPIQNSIQTLLVVLFCLLELVFSA
jgi:hypothetical protein